MKKKVYLLFQQLFLFQIHFWSDFHAQRLISTEKSTVVNQKGNEVAMHLSNNVQLPASHGSFIICRMQVTEGIGANNQQALFFLVTNPSHLQVSLTCQILQAKFPESEVTILSVVKKYRQSISLFIEFGPTNDAQVLQWQVLKLIQSHQNIACDLSDRLKGKNETDTLKQVHLKLI